MNLVNLAQVYLVVALLVEAEEELAVFFVVWIQSVEHWIGALMRLAVAYLTLGCRQPCSVRKRGLIHILRHHHVAVLVDESLAHGCLDLASELVTVSIGWELPCAAGSACGRPRDG